MILGMFVHYIPLSCTSSPCNPLFLNLGARCWYLYVWGASYARVQATVVVGTVLFWDIGVAYTRGGGTTIQRSHKKKYLTEHMDTLDVDVDHITSHHITSHHITSHHITSHHITSHHITSHHITSHHITSHHITSHHITSHHITSQYIALQCGFLLLFEDMRSLSRTQDASGVQILTVYQSDVYTLCLFPPFTIQQQIGNEH